MAVIHQRLKITAIYQSIRGLPPNKASGHASPHPHILTAVAQMLLINNSAAFTAPQTLRGRCCGPPSWTLLVVAVPPDFLGVFLFSDIP